MNPIFRKQMVREFPELAAGYHLPIMAEVLAIPDAPKSGGVNSNYRPRLAVDLVLINQDYQHTEIKLDAVPVAITGGGHQRGFFALPQPGTLVEVAWLNGLPERPFVRSVLGDRQALPWLDDNTMAWQQDQTTRQSVDKNGNWERTTAANIKDSAHTLEQDLVKLLQTIGSETKRVLEHSIEDIDGKKVIEAGAIHQLSASVLNLFALGNLNLAAAGNMTRSASGNLTDHSEGDLKQTAAKVYLGTNADNLLKILSDVVAELATAMTAISTLTVTATSLGAPTTPPINAASFTNAATAINALKSKIDGMTL